MLVPERKVRKQPMRNEHTRISKKTKCFVYFTQKAKGNSTSSFLCFITCELMFVYTPVNSYYNDAVSYDSANRAGRTCTLKRTTYIQFRVYTIYKPKQQDSAYSYLNLYPIYLCTPYYSITREQYLTRAL